MDSETEISSDRPEDGESPLPPSSLPSQKEPPQPKQRFGGLQEQPSKEETKLSQPKQSPECTPTPLFSKSSTFTLSVTGTIDRVFLPAHNHLYAKYSFAYGTDWAVITGVEEGVTQVGKRSPFLQDLESTSTIPGQVGKLDDDVRSSISWNHPLDISFASSNPFGWPQIVLAVYGIDSWGNDVIRGYGATHVPPINGSEHKISVPLFIPESSSLLGQFRGWLTGARPEFLDPKISAHGEGRGVLNVQSTGTARLTLNVILSDFGKHGYRSS